MRRALVAFLFLLPTLAHAQVSLDNATRQLEVVLTSSPATELPWYLAYYSSTDATAKLIRHGTTAGTSARVMLDGPPDSFPTTSRTLTFLSLHNPNGSAVVSTLYLHDGDSTRTLWSGSMAGGDTLVMDAIGDVRLLDSAGNTKVTTGGTGTGAPTGATYHTQTPDGTLSAEQAWSLLGTGLVLNTTATGVASIFGGSACSAGEFAFEIDAEGALRCDTPAGSSGDGIRVEDGDNTGAFTAATDADFDDGGDINFALDTSPSPDVITATIRADSVALTTDTTGNYAAGDAEAGSALTGDSATAFFSAGQLEPARGGTGDDTSASTGVPRITAGNWTYDAGISHLAASTSADLRGVLSDETGTGAAMFGLTTAMADDLGCSGSQVVRRNAGDAAFECATVSGGSGLTHPEVMSRTSLGF